MRPCINQLTTKTTPFDKDVEAYARAGFDAVEVFLPKVEASSIPSDVRVAVTSRATACSWLSPALG